MRSSRDLRYILAQHCACGIWLEESSVPWQSGQIRADVDVGLALGERAEGSKTLFPVFVTAPSWSSAIVKKLNQLGMGFDYTHCVRRRLCCKDKACTSMVCGWAGVGDLQGSSQLLSMSSFPQELVFLVIPPSLWTSLLPNLNWFIYMAQRNNVLLL